MSQAHVSNLHDFCQPEPVLFASCDDSLIEPAVELDERFIKGRDAGFSVDTVKDYVATLTDRSVQRRLREPKRNQSFTKVPLDNRDGEEFILCESDDLVFEFNCKATSGYGVHYWFVKQEARNMLSEECALLYNLHRWKQYTEARARAREKLHILRHLIQFYLG